MLMQLKPQDFLVALKLVAWGEQRWTYARLAQDVKDRFGLVEIVAAMIGALERMVARG